MSFTVSFLLSRDGSVGLRRARDCPAAAVRGAGRDPPAAARAGRRRHLAEMLLVWFAWMSKELKAGLWD